VVDSRPRDRAQPTRVAPRLSRLPGVFATVSRRAVVAAGGYVVAAGARRLDDSDYGPRGSQHPARRFHAPLGGDARLSGDAALQRLADRDPAGGLTDRALAVAIYSDGPAVAELAVRPGRRPHPGHRGRAGALGLLPGGLPADA